jgi:hypothetical protein
MFWILLRKIRLTPNMECLLLFALWALFMYLAQPDLATIIASVVVVLAVIGAYRVFE